MFDRMLWTWTESIHYAVATSNTNIQKIHQLQNDFIRNNKPSPGKPTEDEGHPGHEITADRKTNITIPSRLFQKVGIEFLFKWDFDPL